MKSRFGGRLEPLCRVKLVLHEGRGELCTVTQADTVHAHAALRERRASLERATQACEAVLRLLDSAEPNRPAYNLLCHELALLDADPAAASRAQALAFRLKLLLAAGFAPELAACAACGEREHLGALLARAPAAWSAPAARPARSRSASEAHAFLVEALARPLAEAPEAAERALAQADRAIAETLEHHAHVRLRRVPRLSRGAYRTRLGIYDLAVETAATKLVYDFAEGSREMRDLLGGKGANVAEMTRILGAERVPAGFTITTEACVAYMNAGRASRPTARGAGRRGARRAWRSRPASGSGDAERPAARVGPLGRARVDARDAGHGPQPRPERRVGRGPRGDDRQRAVRLGLLPPLRADVRQRLPRRARGALSRTRSRSRSRRPG